nr:hypothetical protein AX774_g1318 [Ipomoea batatas]GMD58511.1 hypothetical protein AX774_g1318 [Ipomoea batatas]
MTALLSFPLVISHRFSKSRMTITRNLFSCSSTIDPDMDPIAQHNVLRLFHDQSSPSSCLLSFFNICSNISSWSRCER